MISKDNGNETLSNHIQRVKEILEKNCSNELKKGKGEANILGTVTVDAIPLSQDEDIVKQFCKERNYVYTKEKIYKDEDCVFMKNMWKFVIKFHN